MPERPATTARRHLAIEGRSRSSAQRIVGLRRGGPLEQVAAADEEPAERAADRIQHQPGLVSEEGDEQAGLRAGACRASDAEAAEMAARRDRAACRGTSARSPAGSSGGMAIVSRMKPVQTSAARERQRPAGARAPATPPAPTASAADCRASSSSRSRQDRRLARPPVTRPSSHGRSCQSPRAQRCWRARGHVVAGREILDDLDVGDQARRARRCLRRGRG